MNNIILKRLPRSLWSLAMPFIIAGCSFIPHYQRPSLPVPAQYPYSNNVIPAKAGPHTGHSLLLGIQGNAYDIGWHEFFKDPRLQQLIELALKNNRDFRTALLNVQQIRAQYRIVQYGLLPSFGVDAPVTEERELATSNKYITLHSYQVDVNTAYEVDLFGHIRSLQAQALEQYFATREASRAAQITLVAQVATQYLTERALDEQLDLLQQTLDSVQSYYDLINKSYQLGNSTALDLRLAEGQVESAKAAIAADERQRAQADDALMLLVGQSLPEDLPQPQPLAEQDIMQDLPAGLSSDLLERRPDILEAEHQLKSANANIGVVKAAFFPSITLTALDGTASTKISKFFTPGSNVWAFAPDISLPLFNQNTNLANLDVAKFGKEIQVAQYEKVVQTAFREVSDALVARDTYNQQITAQRALVQAQHERYDLSSARYKNGVDNYLTVLLAQQDLYTAQQNLIQVSLDRFTNLISLYKALGGGWSS